MRASMTRYCNQNVRTVGELVKNGGRVMNVYCTRTCLSRFSIRAVPLCFNTSVPLALSEAKVLIRRRVPSTSVCLNVA